MDGVQVSADLKRALDVLFTGPYSLKIDTVKWQAMPASTQSVVQGVAISGGSSADGDYYKYTGQLGVDSVQTPGFSATMSGIRGR